MNSIGIGTDVELLPKVLVRDTADDMTKALALRDIHAGLGSKKEPSELSPGIMCHPDSCGVEVTTPPVHTADEFCDALATAKRLAEDAVGMRLVYRTHYNMTGVMDALAAIAPDVLRVILSRGCDADWVVDGPGEVGLLRKPPGASDGTDLELGGHLHIDLPEHHRTEEGISRAVSMLDHMLVGYLDSRMPGSWYRRPGVFRPKPYGLEYRSLGAEALGNHAREIFVAVHTNIEEYFS